MTRTIKASVIEAMMSRLNHSSTFIKKVFNISPRVSVPDCKLSRSRKIATRRPPVPTTCLPDSFELLSATSHPFSLEKYLHSSKTNHPPYQTDHLPFLNSTSNGCELVELEDPYATHGWFDVRGRPFNQALLWSDALSFGPRAYFVTGKRPVAALQLDAVQLKDAGVYRCRVDFRNSPTRNFQVKLTVIVPPHQLIIYDNSGKNLSDTVGPLTEESDLLLTCEVRGGEPTPTVSWFMNEKLTEGQLDKAAENVIINKLSLPRLKRHHLNNTFKCQASNTKLMQPAEKTVRLEMFLRPINVELSEKPKMLVAEEEYRIQCSSLGSRPQAELTWFRENRKYKKAKVRDDVKLPSYPHSENLQSTHIESTSPAIISLCTPCCPLTAGAPFLLYPPVVSLQLGTSLKPHQIKEGDDVYFECNVRANPRQHKITWYHNGEPVTQNMSSGVLISALSLVLQGVTRQHGGSYTCMAANSRGQTFSQPVFLRIQYAPVCVYTEPVIVGASLEEAVKVKCLVSADPTDLSFFWQFNNSGESFQVAPSRYATSNGTISELIYTPKSERDYGTLTCSASNSIGRQAEPCLFQVVPATKPGPLHNCTLRSTVNTTGDWLEVECIAGFDGGLSQTFHLEAVDSLTSKYCLNASNVEGPFFRVELAALSSGHPGTIQLVMYAANQKGRSELVVLEDIAIRDAEKRTVTVCALRKKAYNLRNSSTTPTKQIEITQGDDQRYVVSYQVKSEIKQPDILNRVSEEQLETDGTNATFNGPRVNPTFTSPTLSPGGCQIQEQLAQTSMLNNVHGTTHNIISNSIPGPESCV
ncbi:unnamed protein product [Nezara viridula]|uniref:Ig-like domain-containing protein n=1 Tax=Nezara viridula TaxID=85310 RepID=A0A9P0E8M3_NEZVI|nr:unnamed protein product [Nezara viridula]